VTPYRKFLRPLSIPYEMAARLRAWSYHAGIMHSKRLPGVVISVGNLTVGGTAKTPFVIWLVSKLLRDGNHVAVLTRGYGGDFQGILRDSENTQHNDRDGNARRLSDETQLMLNSQATGAGNASHFAIGVGANRFLTGSELARSGFEWFVLDDGF